MSQRTKEFPTKNSGDYNNQWNEITGQTDLNQLNMQRQDTYQGYLCELRS